MIRRVVTWTGLVLVIGLVAIQLVPYGRDHTNPPVAVEPAWDSEATRALAAIACADCHSNRTEWPWYSNIAPVSWLVQRDVDEGREALNWSVPSGEAEESAEKVREGEMPPWIYTVTHPAAKLSDADREALITGLIATFGGEGGDEGGEGD
jgi:mono/diheme cytochrome c family protein